MSENPQVIISKRVIQIIPQEELQPLLMINIFKYLTQFLEFSYALKQRINTEVEMFNEHFACNIDKPPTPSLFDSFCNKRGSLIHSGNLKLIIDPDTAILKLGEINCIDSINTVMDEVCFWINDIYSKMCDVLER